MGCPHLELDSFYWGPNWTPREASTFRTEVRSAIACESWVADGNYHAVRDLVWGRADTLIWLDYTIGTVLLRLIKRTFRRLVMREELWNGNRERGWEHLTRKSLFLWAFQTHWRRRRSYGVVTARDYPHLEVKRFYSPTEAEDWLAGVNRGGEAAHRK